MKTKSKKPIRRITKFRRCKPCYVCNSTVRGHHTPLCSMAEVGEFKDLGTKLGTLSEWDGRLPRKWKVLRKLAKKNARIVKITPAVPRVFWLPVGSDRRLVMCKDGGKRTMAQRDAVYRIARDDFAFACCDPFLKLRGQRKPKVARGFWFTYYDRHDVMCTCFIAPNGRVSKFTRGACDVVQAVQS